MAIATQTSDAARLHFQRRFFDYVQSLGSDEWFSVSLAAQTEFELDARVALSAPHLETRGVQDDLFDLFADRGSPLVVPSAAITLGQSRSQTSAPSRKAWLLRPRLFADATGTRHIAAPLEYRDNGLTEVVAALLKAPGCLVRFFVRPSSTGVEALRTLLADRLSRAPKADQLASKVSVDGLPLDAQVVVTSPDELPRSLRAALLGLAYGCELVEVDITAATIEASVKSRLPVQQDGTGWFFTGFASEIASLVRFPGTEMSVFPGAAVVPSQLVRAGHDVPVGDDPGRIRMGQVLDQSGRLVDAHIDDIDFDRHLYVPGQTGSGKSTFMRGLAVEVARRGQGLLFIDPHGNTVERLLGELPPERHEDVVFIDAASLTAPAPINPFAVSDPMQKDTALENVVEMFYDLFDPHQTGIVGPRWETWFRMGMLTLLAAHGRNASILDVPALYFDKDYLAACRRRVTNPIVIDFWDKEMEQTSEKDKSEMLGWFSSKFTAFRVNSVLKAVLGSGADVLDASQVMDSSKIVLVSLAKGDLGERVTQLLGYVYLTRFWTAALRRKSPQPFSVFVDEAHSFTKGSLPAMLSEGRKFGVRVIMANQFMGQIPEDLRGSVLGNVGNVIALRLGSEDAESLGSRFSPEFESRSLRMMPNFRAAASVLASGSVVPSFSLIVDHESRLGPRREQSRRAGALRRESRKFLRAVAEGAVSAANAQRQDLHEEVAKERKEKLAQLKLAQQERSAAARARSVEDEPSSASVAETGSKFLDDWLEQRQSAANSVVEEGALGGPQSRDS